MRQHYENKCRSSLVQLKKTQRQQKNDPRNLSEAEIENRWPSKFSLGDLVWVKFPKNPYWPGIVTLEPPESNNVHTEIKKKGIYFKRFYHVQFFEEPAQRNWVDSSNMLKFGGKYVMYVCILLYIQKICVQTW